MRAVLYEVQGDIALLTLNRPESLNALNLAMIDDLRTCTARAAFDPAVRAVIVRGAVPAAGQARSPDARLWRDTMRC